MIRNFLKSLLAISIGIVLLGCSFFAHQLYGNGISTFHNAFSDSILSSNNYNPLYASFLVHSEASKSDDYRIRSFPLSTFPNFPVPSIQSGLESKFSLLLKPYFSRIPNSAYDKRNPTVFAPNQTRINYKRVSLFGMANAGTIFFGFKHAMSLWGKSNGKFHVKDDWKGDHLAQTDELSHCMWGYRMTEFLFSAYYWMGLSSKASQILSMFESALILTAVEYPIDAYNPKQGLGISDLIFDYLGVGLALAKKHVSPLEDFDFKISWKNNSSSDYSVFAQTYAEYDNFVYWLTYRTKLFLPKKILSFGLGYGVTHKGIEPQRRFYGAIGLSLSDFASLFSDKLEKRVKFLDLFYPHLGIKL